MNVGQTPELDTALIARSALRINLLARTRETPEQAIPCRHIVTLLGSRRGCKIILQNKKVHPVHLAIVNTGTHVAAVDLVTSFGTLLNGLKMQFERLNNGDVLTVAPWEFRVQIEGPERNGHADEHTFGLEPTPQVIALEHMATHRLLRLGREVCVLGRRQGCDIVVNDHAISRAHAVLFTYFGHPIVADLLSRNQTLVNNLPISLHMLHNNDILTVGETKFRVRLVGAGSVERPSREVENHKGPIQINKEEPGPDLIDIKATEGSQRWHIAESLEKANQGSGRR